MAFSFAVCRVNLYFKSLAVLTRLQNCKEPKDIICLLENVDFFFSFFSPLDPFMAIFRAKYESLSDFVFC